MTETHAAIYVENYLPDELHIHVTVRRNRFLFK